MSHTVYKSDYIIVTGDLYIFETVNGDIDNGTLGVLSLDFTVQINGKLKSFNHRFDLSENETNSEQLGLKNYREWYVLYETLGELGYKIGEYIPEAPQKGNIIDEWIKNLEDLK